MVDMNHCDNCKHFHWYHDYCDKWDCEVFWGSVYACFEPMEQEES